MKNTVNYYKIMENKISDIICEKQKHSLLLHSCCAPCSSSVLEFLIKHFDIYLFFYNPNIFPPEEYFLREKEQENFIKSCFPNKHIAFIRGEYIPQDFLKTVKGLEMEPEGGIRCQKCFELRLRETAKLAKKLNIEYFTTTLSVSPQKNPGLLNELGEKIGLEEGVEYLISDFKKKNGYARSVELSKKYNLYRQDYCGCIFSQKNKIEIIRS